MAEEAEDPGRDLPRATNMIIVVVLVVYIGMPLAGLSAMPVGSNTVPVNERTGRTLPVKVIPAEPEGTYALPTIPRRRSTSRSRRMMARSLSPLRTPRVPLRSSTASR